MFSVKDKGLKITFQLNHLLKGIKILLLLIIAYNSSFLKGIYSGVENLSQRDKVIINVSSTQPNEQRETTPTKENPITSTDTMTKKPIPSEEKRLRETTSAETQKTTQENGATAQDSVVQSEENTNPVTHKVEMLNNSPEGAMVFNPPFIHIKTGDSVEFVPASYGHNVQTPEEIIGGDQAIPKGASPFKGAMNESLIVKFTVPGVYLYVCNYHYIVGHVGVIQVGNDSHNLDSVKEAGEKLKGKIFSHPERVDEYLDKVKVF